MSLCSVSYCFTVFTCCSRAQVCEAAVEAKVDVLVLCDTNGGTLPWEVGGEGSLRAWT